MNIDPADLENAIRDVCDARGFFNRETRRYSIRETNMDEVCRDVARRLNVLREARAA
jgi:hypothetical protein